MKLRNEAQLRHRVVLIEDVNHKVGKGQAEINFFCIFTHTMVEMVRQKFLMHAEKKCR